MSKPYDGGPAFPWREEDGAGGYCQHVGMSLRDWFAVYCPESEIPKFVVGDAEKRFGGSKPKHFMLLRCEARYAWADAMLAEHAKGGGK